MCYDEYIIILIEKNQVCVCVRVIFDTITIIINHYQ